MFEDIVPLGATLAGIQPPPTAPTASSSSIKAPKPKAKAKPLFCCVHNAACQPQEQLFILKSGFSCKSVSRANTRYSANKRIIKGALQDEGEATESTARTFKATLQVLEKLQPPYAILENVDSLADEGAEEASNIGTIFAGLNRIGYVVETCYLGLCSRCVLLL